jgi:DNA-binding NarL/FixJ family response regulator
MIKVLLIEKNLILADTLCHQLNKEQQLNIVGICREGKEVLLFLKEHSVDIVLVDPNQTNGYVVTAQIKKEYPNIIIVGFSDDITYTKNRMLELGASHYFSKYETSLDTLITEIKKLPDR